MRRAVRKRYFEKGERIMAEIKNITTPLTEEVVKDLHAGDFVRITGPVYTARDAAHKRMYEALQRGEKLPFDVQDQVIYYVGPTPAKPGEIVGSAGPTTSGRMDNHRHRRHGGGHLPVHPQ